MTEVTLVNLKKGEKPPPGPPKPVIVDCRGSGGAEISDSAKQMVIRVRYAELQSTIAGLAEKGVKKIYVRGLDDA
jgi:hypothetical protein